MPPAQRHDGHDVALFAARHAVSTQARSRNPRRWSQHTRNRTPAGPVAIKINQSARDSIVSEPDIRVHSKQEQAA